MATPRRAPSRSSIASSRSSVTSAGPTVKAVARSAVAPLIAAAIAAALVVTSPAPGYADPEPGPTPVHDPPPDPGASGTPNPGPSGTPKPGPSYSPPPKPKKHHKPSSDAVKGAAAKARKEAQAEGTVFYSSFEPGDTPPTWVDTSEKSKHTTGVLPGGIPGSVNDKIVDISASGEYEESGEIKENLADTDVNTKWLVIDETAWVVYQLSEPVAVTHYALTSANDAPDRDPKSWKLQGSTDGKNWTTVDSRRDQTFTGRFQRKEYRFDNTTAYPFYRLRITANRGEDRTQLAEWELSDGSTSPPPADGMRSRVGDGPHGGYVAKPRAGFTGVKAYRYMGGTTSEKGGYSYHRVFKVDIPVKRTTQLSYLVFPEFTAASRKYPSTYVSVDLAFSDGTYLSELGARDQHGAVLSPRGQGKSKTLYADQWNYKLAAIGDVARGKRIERILVAYDGPHGPLGFRGWVDDIKIVTDRQRQPYAAAKPAADSPADYVLTTRGTHSTGGFSRGNNFPATAVPHGFNFWTPVTDAGSTSWLYEYHRGNNELNLPEIQAFAASHEPSPWMGDRQTFQVMPSTADGQPDPGREARALPFRHENEIARPHYYGVTFENGLTTEIAPTDHAAVFRFTFPGGADSPAKLLFDNVTNDGGLTLDRDKGVVTGYSDVRSGLSTGATRMFYYATFDKPVTSGKKLTGTDRDNVLGYLGFDAGKDRTVTMRIASSLISIEQAKRNLHLEVANTDTVETVAERGRKAWDAKLGVIEVEGATRDQRTTLYSNLYRLFLYPNSGYENTGTTDNPVIKHAVQSATETVPSSPTETGAPVVDGRVYVNNGFWDTYRTTWPAYALFTPSGAGEMVDGFVQQYRDGGWIARWSSPGYADLMVGTSSDVAFADAYVKGVGGFDAEEAYDAAIRNATVAPPSRHVGRKGLKTSPFLGYTSIESTGEAMSWALDGYINDFGIAMMAKALAAKSSGAKKQRYLDDHQYFLNRAQNYVHMYDPAVDCFQGRYADGTWRHSPETFDPRVWGYDYTETNGWNMAFHVPHDGQGLANLYGGRDKLAGQLDTFFTAPETAMFPGSYGGVIHEMREARDVRMGMYGHSNQPSHHIPYMYNYVGQPSKTQATVREVLSRLYLGSEIGQGYAGDEDNGEMSAWYVFSALGFYPLQMGSPYYAIGSPLFTKATVHLENGKDLVIKAPKNNARNVYVKGVTVNGKTWNKTYLPHDVVAKGGTISFDMSSKPTTWGTGKKAAPPSITKGDEVPEPLRDTTGPGPGTPSGSGDVDAGPAYDNDSSTEVTLTGGKPWLRYDFADDTPRSATFYTLTSGAQDGADPGSWVLEGSNDGESWTTLDERTGETFRWRSQTRAFRIDNPGEYRSYRLRFTGGGKLTVAEVELLNPGKPDTSTVTARAKGAVAGPGETATVRLTVGNYSDGPISGEVTATASEGWTVKPDSADLGPLDPGKTTALDFEVTVPDGAKPGDHPIEFTVATGTDTVRTKTAVTVVGDRIQFTPGTDAETPWLYDDQGSQLDGEVYDGRARFTDGDSYVTYKLVLPADVSGGDLTVDIGNQYRIEVSTDNENWEILGAETEPVRDLSNRGERSFDLNQLRGDGRTVYVRISDSQPDDGWGGWLARMTVTLQRSS